MNRTEQQIMQAWPEAQEPLLSITCPAFSGRNATSERRAFLRDSSSTDSTVVTGSPSMR